MFTGLIEELGRVVSFESLPSGARFMVKAEIVTGDLADGDSIAVNGICLTALNVTQTSFAADLSTETLDRTTLSRLASGTRVNLERAVTPQTRLGGHIVQGHVDGRGTLISAEGDGGFMTVRISYPTAMARYFIEKGSVAVEGISLTIASLSDESFDIAVIPKTWEMTNLSTLSAGNEVNLEVDVIAKYVRRMMDARTQSSSSAGPNL